MVKFREQIFNVLDGCVILMKINFTILQLEKKIINNYFKRIKLEIQS